MTQTAYQTALASLNAATSVPPMASFAVKAAAALTQWYIRRNTRLALRHLDPSQLRDIGLSRERALDEAKRHFWQG